MGVDEQRDEDNPDEAKGKGKLLSKKSGKKTLFRHEGNGQKKRMHEVRHSKVVIPESGREKQEIENRGVECARIVKRLLFLIDTQVASLKKGGLVLGWEELQKVLLALEAEADGAEVNLFLDEGNEISAYVKRSLFDELLGEPSNIFFTTKVDSKTLRYEALPKSSRTTTASTLTFATPRLFCTTAEPPSWAAPRQPAQPAPCLRCAVPLTALS